MRDTKSLTGYTTKMLREAKQKLLSRFLRKEVNIGNNGTQDYIIKKGPNKGSVAKKK